MYIILAGIKIVNITLQKLPARNFAVAYLLFSLNKLLKVQTMFIAFALSTHAIRFLYVSVTQVTVEEHVDIRSVFKKNRNCTVSKE